MPIPSRLMGSGLPAQAAQNICGDVATSLTATGTTATDAYQLSAVINHFGTVAASTGAKLMPTEAGAMVIVRNSGASTLTLYPPTGSTINGATSIAVPAATTVLVFATAGTTWFAMTAGAAIGVFTNLTATGNVALGDAVTDTIGFYGVTGIAQRAGSTQVALTITTATTAGFSFTTTTAFSNFVAQVEEIRATLVALGLYKGAA